MSQQPEMYRVYLQTVPEIGTGWRYVFATEGRKWVHVLDWTTFRTTRLRVADWGRLRPEPVPYDAKRVRQKMKRLARSLPVTNQIKEVMEKLS